MSQYNNTAKYAVIICPEVNGNYGERIMKEDHSSLKFTSSILTSPGKLPQKSLVTKREQRNLGMAAESVIRAKDRRF